MKKANIKDLFSKEQLSKFKENYEGNLKGPCPSCGRQDNYSDFIIFPETNTCVCMGSKTKFNFAETIALLNGIISCREGRPCR